MNTPQVRAVGVLIGAIVTALGMTGIAAAAPPLPAGQVWQCLANGQRIFSDHPCGANASIRQLNTVNTMDAAPAGNPVHWYPAPRRDEAADEPDDSAGEAEPESQSAPVVIYGAVGRNLNRLHPRRGHDAHPHPHPHPVHGAASR